MHLLEGALAILAGIGLYGLAYGWHHRADGPRWTQSQLFASSVSLVLCAVVPVGAGLVALGLGEPMDPMAWAGVAALAVSSLLLWRVLRA